MIKQAIGRIQTATKKVTRTELDALDLLRSDHMKLEALLIQLRVIRNGERRMGLFIQIRNDLEKHMKIEEELFYPACGKITRLKGLVAHSYEEHQEVRTLLNELESIDPSSSIYSRRVTKLIANIEEHVMDEEDKLFPAVRKWMPETSFRRLSRQMVEAHGEAHAAPSKKTRKAA